MTSAYLTAVVALALLTVLPGPDVAIVTQHALTGGRRAAQRVTLGVVTGLAVWGTLTVAGLAALLAASTTAYTIVKFAGAAYLVYLGVRTLWRSRRPSASDLPAARAAAGAPYRTGLFTNLLNPKIAVFYTGLLPSLVPPGGSPRVWLPALVATHVALTLAWLGAYGAALARSRSMLGRSRVRMWLDRVTGGVLLGLGIRVAAQP